MLKCGEQFDTTQFMNPVKKHLDLYGMLSQLFFLLKEYSSLQENPYNVRYIHNVLIIHIYFAPQAVDNVLNSVSIYCSAHALGHTHIDDITGPAAGLISYVSSQWHTVVSSYTH